MLLIKNIKKMIVAGVLAVIGATAFALPAYALSPIITYSYPGVNSGVATSYACVQNSVNNGQSYVVRLRRVATNGTVSYGTGAYVSYSSPCANLSVSGMKAGDTIQGYDPIGGAYFTLRKI